MNNPVSTYRIQFHQNFTFADFNKIIPYLKKLGVGTVYASPIFEATPGSEHGYDGVNPHKINPEIGTEEQLLEIDKKLKKLGISWLQDIVPNHMAFDPNNPWLKDVLEKGQKSVYSSFFDVPWTGKIYHGKIMLPFLGKPLQEVIESNELVIAFEEPRFVVKYFDNSYPLRLRSYITILQAGDGEPNQAIQQLLEQVKDVQKAEEPEAYKETLHEFQLQLTALIKTEKTRLYLENCLKNVNTNKGIIKRIIDEQVYQLVNWQKTDYKINFRRFFTVNGLICLNMQDKDVFQHYHTYIKSLLDQDVFQGLRIDHVDGLYDPTKYLDQLRELTGKETYIVVEKILEPGEELCKSWPIQGTTGYDFLAIVNNLFTKKSSKEPFSSFYQKLVNDDTSIKQQIENKKAYILQEHMGGELTNLFNLFIDLDLAENSELEKVDTKTIKEAIAAFLIKCPVYRYYGNQLPLAGEEAAEIKNIFWAITEDNQQLLPATALLENALLQKPEEQNEDYNRRALRFYQRCMQFTGPLMAKGVEDTLMYTYNRFIGHNEVGDAPEAFGESAGDFHQKMIDRQKKWPLTMNATSTHDTKRGEDVRARLNVLTDIPQEWFAAVTEWQQLNKALVKDAAPDANDEYLVYQTLIGTYPMPDQDSNEFESRLQEYLQKALREAKTHSTWAAPDEAYESATKNFAANLLKQGSNFWKSFSPLHQKVCDFGIINSLAQVILKFTCPGLPDIYQGTDLWDLSLVDPDNRRPIDYEFREKLLDEISFRSEKDDSNLADWLWQNRYNGAIKLWLINKLLELRKQNASFFERADYLPLTVRGAYQSNVLAFARTLRNEQVIVAVPLHLAAITNSEPQQALHVDWKDTAIELPVATQATFNSVLFKTTFSAEKTISVQEIFKHLPMAILK